MNSCKIALKLWRAYEKEQDKALFTGYIQDAADAYDRYVCHIQDHGCWQEGAVVEC